MGEQKPPSELTADLAATKSPAAAAALLCVAGAQVGVEAETAVDGAVSA